MGVFESIHFAVQDGAKLNAAIVAAPENRFAVHDHRWE